MMHEKHESLCSMRVPVAHQITALNLKMRAFFASCFGLHSLQCLWAKVLYTLQTAVRLMLQEEGEVHQD